MSKRCILAVMFTLMVTVGCSESPVSSPLAPTAVTEVSSTGTGDSRTAISPGLHVPPGTRQITCDTVRTAPGAPLETPQITCGMLRTAPGGARVTLHWNVVADATGYVVEMGSARGASDLPSVTTPSSVREHSWTVRPGATFVRLKARRSDNSLSAPSNEISLLQEGGKTQLRFLP